MVPIGAFDCEPNKVTDVLVSFCKMIGSKEFCSSKIFLGGDSQTVVFPLTRKTIYFQFSSNSSFFPLFWLIVPLLKISSRHFWLSFYLSSIIFKSIQSIMIIIHLLSEFWIFYLTELIFPSLFLIFLVNFIYSNGLSYYQLFNDCLTCTF